MPLTNDLARLANNANVLISAITTNSTAITTINVGGLNINSSGLSGALSFNNNVTLNASLIANGSPGSAGNILFSNGTATYWSTAPATGVTSVGSGNGLTGGPITSTGTLSVLANNGITANSTGLFVTVGTGTVVNSTGVHVNATYIGTLSANNTTFVNGKSEGNLNVNSALTANNSTNLGGVAASGYQTTAGLSANVATLTSNNASFLGGTAAASYQLNSTLNANIASYLPTYTGVANAGTLQVGSSIVANSSRLVIGTAVGLSANGGIGSAGQVLHSNGTTVYWDTDDQGVTSVATGNGLTGGTITTTGTVSVLANTGIVANATGVYVNATYIGTISANNASFLGGTAAASYQLNSTLSANVATLTANNSTFAFGKSEGNLNVNSAVTVTTNTSTNTFTIGTAAYFTSTGRLGINTNSPQGGLHVNNTFSYFTANSTFGPQIINWSQTPDNTAGYYIFDKSRSAAGANVAIGDNLGTLLYRGYDTSSTVRNSSYITATVTAVNSTAVDSALSVISAGPSSYLALGSNNSEAARIAANGNFGIGNTAPSNKLSVNGTGYFGDTVSTLGSLSVGTADFTTDLAYAPKLVVAGNGPALYLRETDGDDWSISALSNNFNIRFVGDVANVSTYTSPFIIYSGAPNFSIAVAANGNIGVGNSTPNHKLSVNGILYVGNVITLGAAGGGLEGSQIDWAGGNSSYNFWSTDVYSQNFRIFTSVNTANAQLQVFSANASYEAGLYVQGNTGIGTATPNIKLQVAGNMAVDAFVENSANIATSYTITTGRNAMSAGPITINNGVTVTVPSGSTWTIV